MNQRASFIAAALFAALAPLPVTASVNPSYLRCEYRVDPLGIDTLKPRLSWILTSGERAQKQSAYQLIVSSTREELGKHSGDVWDTGKIAGGESIQIEYAGKPLHANQECWWSVRVWDADGKPSGWSKPARWTMGLLNKLDWTAKWIGCDIPRGQVESATYLPSPMLRKNFATRAAIKRALIHITAAGLYELYVDGKLVSRDCLTPGWTEFHKRMYYQTYDVTGLIGDGGKHALAAMIGDGWYGLHHGGRGRLALLGQLHLEYQDGSTEDVTTDESWKCSYCSRASRAASTTSRCGRRSAPAARGWCAS